MKPFILALCLAVAGCSTVTPPTVAPTPSAVTNAAPVPPAVRVPPAVPSVPQRSLIAKSFVAQAIPVNTNTGSVTVNLFTMPTSDNFYIHIDGFYVYYGTQSGLYTHVITNLGLATNITVSNLDLTKPYYFMAAGFQVVSPIIMCNVVNSNKAICQTNTLFQFPQPMVETAYYSAALKPFVSLSNNVATIHIWGDSRSNYTVLSGPSLDTLAPLAAFIGTDSLWAMDTVKQSAQFFGWRAQ